MTASVDHRVLRPYFNAGMLVVDPWRRLMRRWRDDFDQIYRLPEFKAFYEQDRRYAIFMHQAVLAGTILSMLRPAELAELPHLVNYPLHMHRDYPAALRPVRLNDVISVRYEELLATAFGGKWFGLMSHSMRGWRSDWLRAGRPQRPLPDSFEGARRKIGNPPASSRSARSSSAPRRLPAAG